MPLTANIEQNGISDGRLIRPRNSLQIDVIKQEQNEDKCSPSTPSYSLLSPGVLRNTLEKLTTEKLRDEVKSLLQMTAASLLRLALVIDILESRGESFDGLKSGFLRILRKIALGELLPDIVVIFSGEVNKILRIARLPIADQQEIVDGKKLEPPHEKRKRHRKLPNVLRDMAEIGHPKDIGEAAAQLILECRNPAVAYQTAKKLLEEEGLS